MSRPLATVGFTYMAVCALAANLPARLWLPLGAVLGICGLLAACSRHRLRAYAVCILLAAGCACVALLMADTLRLAPARSEAESTAEIYGTVTEIRGASTVELRRDDGISVVVSAREPIDARVGERLQATVQYSLYANSTATPAVRAGALQTPLRGFVLGEYHIAPPAAGTVNAILCSMRQRFSDAILTQLPNDNGLMLCAMLLGERWRIPQEISDTWADAGISHLLAISGYHLALLTAFVAGLLRLLRVSARLGAVLTCVGVLCYMALTGFSPSITRAGVMVILSLLGSVLGREADSLTSLAVAGLIVCAYDPFSALQTSFCLSFIATLGLILFAAPLQRQIERQLGAARFPRLRSVLLSAMAATTCASAATLPVMLLRFQSVPLYAVLTNTVIVPLVPIALLCGLLVMLLGALPVLSMLTVPFAVLANAACVLLISVAEVISRLPFAVLPAGAGFLRIWMCGAAVLIAVVCIRPARRKAMACALLCVITLMVGALSYQLVLRGAVSLTVIETSKAAAFVAVKDGRAVILGDVRNRADAYAIRRVLERERVRRIELVALTPIAGERGGAVSALLMEYHIDTALLGVYDKQDERMKQALGVAEMYDWNGAKAQFFGDCEVLLTEGGTFAKFAESKAFILGPECDILKDMLQVGQPTVAVLYGERAANAERLRCAWLIDCAGEGLGPVAQRETLLLGEAGETAEFLLKNGRTRLL